MHLKMLDRITDNYNKNEDGFIGKWYQIVSRELMAVEKAMADIQKYQDIDNAVQSTLDKIGKNVLEYRNAEEDDMYRLFIKTKIIANLSKGDIETINQVATTLLGDGFVGIKETWNLPRYNNEVAGLVLTMRNKANQLPFDAINRTIAGGIGVHWVLEYKQDTPEIYIGMATIGGEEITVYPYSITDISTSTKVYIGLGHNTSTEEITVYPQGE